MAAPVFADPTGTPQMWTVNDPIATLQVPEATVANVGMLLGAQQVSGADVALGTGTWRGAFAIGDRVWGINDTNDRLIAYDHSGGTLTRNAANDVALGTGTWGGGFAIGDRVWVVEDGANTLRAYDHSGGTLTRNAANDVALGTGTWWDGFAIGDRAWVMDANALRAYDHSGGTLTRNAANDVALGTGTWRGAFAIGDRVWGINDTNDRLIAYDHSGGTLTRNAANDVALGTGTWRGAFAIGDRAWVVDNSADVLRAYDLPALSTQPVELGPGEWQGGFAIGDRAWVVDNSADVLRAYDHSGGTLTRNAANDVTLLSRLWRGGFSVGDRIWLVDDTNDYLRAYDHSNGTLTRNSTNDVSLGIAAWQGGFAIGDRVWVINSGANSLRAYDHSGGTLTRNAANDVALESSSWQGGFAIGDRAWVVDNSADVLRAYDHSGGTLTRNAANDVTLLSTTWTGGLTVGSRAWVIAASLNILVSYELIAPATYSASMIPSALDFDPDSREITGTPDATRMGTIRITAMNLQGSDEWSVDYVIEPDNQPPMVVIDTMPTTVAGDATIAILATATDPDDNISTYLWTGSGTFDPDDTEDTMWTAPASQATDQMYTLRLTVMDDEGLMAHAEVDITVKAHLVAETARAADRAPAPAFLAAPSFTDDTGDATMGTVGTAIADIVVPAASGFPAPTYAEVGTLPAGVTFDDSTRTLSFDENDIEPGAGTITIRATNSQGSDDWTVDYTFQAAPLTGRLSLFDGPVHDPGDSGDIGVRWSYPFTAFPTTPNATRAHLIANNEIAGDITPETFEDQGGNNKRIDWLALHHGNDFVILNLNSSITNASEDDFRVAFRERGTTNVWDYLVSSDASDSDPYEMPADQADLTALAAVITGGGTLDAIIYDESIADDLAGWDGATLTYTGALPRAAPAFDDDTGDDIAGRVGAAITPVTIPRATGNPPPYYIQVGETPSGLTVTLPTQAQDGSITGTPDAADSGEIGVMAVNSEGTALWTVQYAIVADRIRATPAVAEDTASGPRTAPLLRATPTRAVDRFEAFLRAETAVAVDTAAAPRLAALRARSIQAIDSAGNPRTLARAGAAVAADRAGRPTFLLLATPAAASDTAQAPRLQGSGLHAETVRAVDTASAPRLATLRATAIQAVDTVSTPTLMLRATPLVAVDTARTPRLQGGRLQAEPVRAVDTASAPVLFLRAARAVAADTVSTPTGLLRATSAVAVDSAPDPRSTLLRAATVQAVDTPADPEFVPVPHVLPLDGFRATGTIHMLIRVQAGMYTRGNGQVNLWASDQWTGDIAGEAGRLQEGNPTVSGIAGNAPTVTRFGKWDRDNSNDDRLILNSINDNLGDLFDPADVYHLSFVRETATGHQLITLPLPPSGSGSGFVDWRTSNDDFTDEMWDALDAIATDDEVILAIHQGTASYHAPLEANPTVAADTASGPAFTGLSATPTIAADRASAAIAPLLRATPTVAIDTAGVPFFLLRAQPTIAEDTVAAPELMEVERGTYVFDLGDIDGDDDWRGAIKVNSRLVVGGGDGYLRHVGTVGESPEIVFTETATDSVPQPHEGEGGQQLIGGWETYVAALVFTDGAGNSVTLKGPNHPDNSFRDPNNPYFWTADNGDAWSTFWGRDKTSVTLRLQAPLPPLFPVDTYPEQIWIPGAPITPITAPEADGFPAPTYAAINIPDGITFDPVTRRIDGTPTRPQSSTLIVTATNTEGGDTWRFDYEVLALRATPAVAIDTARAPSLMLVATPTVAADTASAPSIPTLRTTPTIAIEEARDPVLLLVATLARAVDRFYAFLRDTETRAADTASAPRIATLRATPTQAVDDPGDPRFQSLAAATVHAVDTASTPFFLLRATPTQAVDNPLPVPLAGLRAEPAVAVDQAAEPRIIILRATPAIAVDEASAPAFPQLEAIPIVAADQARAPIFLLSVDSPARAVDHVFDGRVVLALRTTPTVARDFARELEIGALPLVAVDTASTPELFFWFPGTPSTPVTPSGGVEVVGYEELPPLEFQQVLDGILRHSHDSEMMGEKTGW